jgi:hypothetical protein
MTDQKRNQNRGQQQRAPEPPPDQDRGTGRDFADTAEDRGLDRERRNVGGPREGDQLQIETDSTRTDEISDLDDDEELGGFGRSNR